MQANNIKNEDCAWTLVRKDGQSRILHPGLIFIGREECDIILQSASADKRHAVLFYSTTEQEFHIKDLNSVTGTYVNGAHIPEQTYVKLKHLDCIRFGYGPDIFYLHKTTKQASALLENNFLSNDKDEQNVEHTEYEANIQGEEEKENQFSSDAYLSIDEDNEPIRTTPLTRVDHPPDSLPLLPLAPNGEVEIAWEDGGDHSSGDSPDYSQRSEPPLSISHFPEAENCENNTPDAPEREHENISASSSPAAMAFTVAFECEVSTPRKKFGIRDSISKFAPPKLEQDCRSPFYRLGKTPEPSPKKIPILESRSSAHILTRRGSQGQYDERKQTRIDECGEKKVTETASYLIKRMLSGEVNDVSDAPLKSSESPKSRNDVKILNIQGNETTSDQLVDLGDDKSEAGTYTVETENADGAVEEARKRIDEVFGVMHLSGSGPNFSSVTILSSQVRGTDSHIKQTVRSYKHRDASDSDSSPLWTKTNRQASLSRTKRRLPLAPSDTTSSQKGTKEIVSASHFATSPRSKKSGDGHKVNHSEVRRSNTKIKDHQGTPDKARRPRSATTPKSPGNMSKSLTMSQTSREPSGKEDDAPHHIASDSRSEGSKSPHTSTQWRRVPWNLCSSDLDLDHNKSETTSVLSDTSTEPSSQSSHSGKSKPETKPQMRLNRAFALRRARLECEDSKDSKVTSSSKECGQKNLRSPGKGPRDDVGRVNLRLSPAISKSLSSRDVKNKEELKAARMDSPFISRKKGGCDIKSGHRRIESDPGKGIPSWKKMDAVKKGALSDSEKKSLNVLISGDDGDQSVHRSASFSGTDGAVPPKSKGLPISASQRDFLHRPDHQNHPVAGREKQENVQNKNQIPFQVCENRDLEGLQEKGDPNRKELSALDNLVISAIYQLSLKLRSNARSLLEKHRERFSEKNDCSSVIDEVLPQISEKKTESSSEGNLTRDLSCILKNLKRVEQCLDVLSSVLDSGETQQQGESEGQTMSVPQNFFIVDV